MKKTRRQRRALAKKATDVANQLYYAQNKAVLLAKQKAIRDDKRDDLKATEDLKP